MNSVNIGVLYAAARNVLTAVGAGLVAYGAAKPEDVAGVVGNLDQILGGVMALVGFGSAVYAKYKAETKIEVAKEVSPNAAEAIAKVE